VLDIMKRSDFPYLGCGIGLRRQHYAEVIERRPTVDWLEVISENFMVEGGRPLAVLDAVGEHYPLVMHGVSMSLGSADPLNRGYLRELRALARRVEPAWISDHLCWTGVGGRNLHDLLPLPFTESTLDYVARRIRLVQDYLEYPVLVENVSSYLSYRESAMSEWEFLARVAEKADTGVLLDINNVYVNAFNHHFDADLYLAAIPVERVGQFHLAGHSNFGTHLLDTHDHPIADQVWALYERAIRRFGKVSTLIEWDDNIPALDELVKIADRARQINEKIVSARDARSASAGAARRPPASAA
jgi:uncharacterized protein